MGWELFRVGVLKNRYLHFLAKIKTVWLKLSWLKLCASTVYLLIDLDGVRVPLSLAANQRRGFMEIRHCDWLSPKVGHGRRRGGLVDIFKNKKKIIFPISLT